MPPLTLLRRDCFLPALLVAALLLAGCGTQAVQRQAQVQLDAGQPEAAVQTLEKGLKEHPDSVELRTVLLRTRSDALARLLTDAGAARAQGRFDLADASLRQALRLDPNNARVRELAEALIAERGQAEAASKATKLIEIGQKQKALALVHEALRPNPRHAELSLLRRRLEAEQRQQHYASARSVLSEQRPISLDFRDAPLRTVLDLVSRHSGVNFVLDKDIRPELRVTVYLRSAKVEDALDLVISTHQLAKKVLDDKTVLIYPNTPDKQREYREQIIKVFYLSSGDAKQAASFLRAMLKVQEPFVDERSNMIALRETPEVIQIAERLMSLYDTSEPEVMLELEVLEVRTTRLTELGIKFPDTIALTPLTPAGSSVQTLSSIQDLNSDRIGVSVAGLLINLRREVGDFEILANPKVRARNKETAKVLIGSKVPVVTTTSTATGFVSDSITYLDVGLKLELEPTVYADDDVAIKIGLEVSSLSREIRTSSGGLAYELGTRTASTTLRLRDGETQVLAGLINREERSSASRVPGLGDLPVVGRLFSSQFDNGQRTEVVFAITPRVVRNIRQPDIAESELWVGTESYTRLRPLGGMAEAEATPSMPVASRNEAADPSERRQQAAEPRPTLNLKWKAPATVKVNEVFDVELVGKASVPVRGVSVQMRPDPQAFEVVDIKEGAWLMRDDSKVGVSKGETAAGGALQFGVLRHRPDGVDGEGTLATLRLRALKAGRFELPVVQGKPMAAGDVVPGPATAAPVAVQVQ